MASPYRNRPRRSFWRFAVASGAAVPPDLYFKRFDITRDHKIAAAGSCFAQHIFSNLVRRGYSVIDTEPRPKSLSADAARSFGYFLYSARYGNIYTARQMLQLAQECFGLFKPADIVWTKGSRFYDAMRPSVEPYGLDSAEEVHAHRADHIRRVREMLTTADVLIFTLGLTETWIHTASGTVYPTAPETLAGQYDPQIHSFKNFSYDEVLQDLVALRQLLKEHNPGLRFFFTVSPVPLAATASDQHALVATMYSKSVLRAAAGALYAQFEDVDYFPSYEIIATPFVGPLFYDSDLREVKPEGVATVMKVFFAAHAEASAETAKAPPKPECKSQKEIQEAVVCEEKLLEAFAP
jgi:GSCFA family